MKKIIISLTITLIMLVAALIFTISALSSANEKEFNLSQEYSYTKAICENGHCQDYIILCSGKEVMSKTPITGAAITVPNNWQDPRNQDMIESFCELSKEE